MRTRVTEATNLTDFCEKKWVGEWEEICEAEGNVDLRKAILAREVRKVFRRGIEGDMQFCLFVVAKFQECRADVMLMKARSWEHFKESDWRKYRGWKGIQFMLRLTMSQRRDLLALMPGAGPYGIRKIKHLAASRGIHAPTQGIGRPTTTETEARFRTVVDCLIDVFAKNPWLGPLPDVVCAVLPKKVMARVPSQVRRRTTPVGHRPVAMAA